MILAIINKNKICPPPLLGVLSPGFTSLKFTELLPLWESVGTTGTVGEGLLSCQEEEEVDILELLLA